VTVPPSPPQILTTDSDFLRYAKHLPIRLCGVTACSLPVALGALPPAPWHLSLWANGMMAHDEQPTTMLLKSATTGCNNRPRN